MYAAANYRRGSDISAAIVGLIGVEFRVVMHMFTLADARYRVLAQNSGVVSYPGRVCQLLSAWLRVYSA